MSDIAQVEAILDFWFDGIGDGFAIERQSRLWFGGGEAVDREIRRRFSDDVERAVAGQLDHWRDTPASALALVILLDQFTRNTWRGDAKAYAGDERAREVVEQALANGFDRQLSYMQRTFFYMPLMHSERLSDQWRCEALFEALLAEVPAQGKSAINNNLRFARQHRELIETFGRFPYRNAVLGRESTAAEAAYLAHGGARFGQ